MNKKLFPNEAATDPSSFPDITEDKVRSLRYLIFKHVYRVLKLHDWKRTSTASALKVSIRTVRNHVQEMRKMGWQVPDSEHGGKFSDFVKKERSSFPKICPRDE